MDIVEHGQKRDLIAAEKQHGSSRGTEKSRNASQNRAAKREERNDHEPRPIGGARKWQSWMTPVGVEELNEPH